MAIMLMFKNAKKSIGRALKHIASAYLVLSRKKFTLHDHVFDDTWYQNRYPDTSNFHGTPQIHFTCYGFDEGRQARYFDIKYYCQTNPHLKIRASMAWKHYKQMDGLNPPPARFTFIQKNIPATPQGSYSQWLLKYDSDKEKELESVQELIPYFEKQIEIHIWIDVSSCNDNDALGVLDSVKKQSYQNYICHIWTTNSQFDWNQETQDTEHGFKDSRFVFEASENTFSENFNQWLSSQTENTFALVLQPRDRLDAHALFWVAEYKNTHLNVDAIYTDEDRINIDESRSIHNFKPDFNYELLLSHNYIGDFLIISTNAWKKIGGLPGVYNYQTAYDIIFRLFEALGPDAFGHIPRALNHVTGTKIHMTSSLPLESHLDRQNIKATISTAPEAPECLLIDYEIAQPAPLVSIIIPTRDRVELLKQAITSIQERTTYNNYEIIIVDNGSVEMSTMDYLEELGDRGIIIIRDERKFNYSALNNVAAAAANGEFICLMNNDIEIISPNWLESMLGFAQQPHVGCVGARLWYPDDTLQHAGVLVGYHGVAGHMHKFLKRGEAGYANRAVVHQSLSAVTAAVLLVRKKIYDQVQGLDEQLEVSFNDVDFCLKVRDSGFSNVYVPQAQMYHHESASRGANITKEQRHRESAEISIMKSRYGAKLMEDPAYNPNLTLQREDMSLAFPPRTISAVDLLNKYKTRTNSAANPKASS